MMQTGSTQAMYKYVDWGNPADGTSEEDLVEFVKGHMESFDLSCKDAQDKKCRSSKGRPGLLENGC